MRKELGSGFSYLGGGAGAVGLGLGACAALHGNAVLEAEGGSLGVVCPQRRVVKGEARQERAVWGDLRGGRRMASGTSAKKEKRHANHGSAGTRLRTIGLDSTSNQKKTKINKKRKKRDDRQRRRRRRGGGGEGVSAEGCHGGANHYCLAPVVAKVVL